MKSSRRPRNVPLVVAMLNAGLSAQSLANKAGINPPHLSRIICMRVDNPRPETKAAIAKALGVSVRSIFEGGEA